MINAIPFIFELVLLAGLFLSLTKPQYLIFIILIFTPLKFVIKYINPNDLILSLWHTAFIMIFLLIMVLWFLMRKHPFIKVVPLDIIVFIYILCGLIPVYITYEKYGSLQNALFFLKKFYIEALFYFVIRIWLNKDRNFSPFIKVMLIMISICTLEAIIEFILLNTGQITFNNIFWIKHVMEETSSLKSVLKSYGGSEKIWRVYSVFVQPQPMGVFCLIGICLVLPYYIIKPDKEALSVNKMKYLLPLLLVGLFTILSGTSIYIFFFLLFYVFALTKMSSVRKRIGKKRKTFRPLLFLLAIIFLPVLIFGGKYIAYRIFGVFTGEYFKRVGFIMVTDSIIHFIKVFFQNPFNAVLGYGFFASSSVAAAVEASMRTVYGGELHILNYTYHAGLFGLFLFVAVNYVGLKTSYRLLKSTIGQQEKIIIFGAHLTIVALFISTLHYNSIIFSGIYHYYLFSLAIIGCYDASYKRSKLLMKRQQVNNYECVESKH